MIWFKTYTKRFYMVLYINRDGGILYIKLNTTLYISIKVSTLTKIKKEDFKSVCLCVCVCVCVLPYM